MSWKGRVHLIKIECWSKIGIPVYASHIGLLEFSCLGLCKPVQSNSGLHACNQNLFPSSTMGRVAGLVLSKGCRAYGRTFSQFTSHRGRSPCRLFVHPFKFPCPILVAFVLLAFVDLPSRARVTFLEISCRSCQFWRDKRIDPGERTRRMSEG